MEAEKVTVYELNSKHSPNGWETPEDEENYLDEVMRFGSAMCQWTSGGKMRHVPRPEWTPG